MILDPTQKPSPGASVTIPPFFLHGVTLPTSIPAAITVRAPRSPQLRISSRKDTIWWNRRVFKLVNDF